MKFENESAAKSQREVPPPKGPRIGDIDNGDPLQLRGVRVVLTRSDREPLGTVLGSTIHYGPALEDRVFIKLDQGSTFFVGLDDIEPASLAGDPLVVSGG